MSDMPTPQLNRAAEHAGTASGGSTPAHAVEAEVVNISQGGADVIKANQVHIEMGIASTVYAEDVNVNMGGVVLADSDSLRVEQGGVVMARTQDLVVEDGGVGLAFADTATFANVRAGVVVTQHVELEDARTLVLLSREIHGTVETVLDTRGAALAGIAAGLGVGLMLIIGGLLGRRRK